MVNAVAITVWGWLERLGGIGLILLGLADNSPVPLPGSMDALTIILSAHHRDWWWYYAIMATVGALLGGYMTYALARKGGKEGLQKKLPKKKAEKVHKTFEKYGFWSLFRARIAAPASALFSVFDCRRRSELFAEQVPACCGNSPRNSLWRTGLLGFKLQPGNLWLLPQVLPTYSLDAADLRGARQHCSGSLRLETKKEWKTSPVRDEEQASENSLS